MQESCIGPRPKPRRLPDDAPNMLILMIDDAGPGLPTTFGGGCTPTPSSGSARRVSAYNRFHTTAMCSPTRASLLTGRNPHRVGNGQIASLRTTGTATPGAIPKAAPLVPEVLKNYGYNTAAFGKWHNTPADETTPRDRSIFGLQVMALIISTASLPARPRSMSRTW